jgi:hypothetical protein
VFVRSTETEIVGVGNLAVVYLARPITTDYCLLVALDGRYRKMKEKNNETTQATTFIVFYLFFVVLTDVLMFDSTSPLLPYVSRDFFVVFLLYLCRFAKMGLGHT